MNGWNMVLCWILALPAVATFYFVYGVVEEIFQKRRQSRKRQVKPHSFPIAPIKTPLKVDLPAAAHGYDSPELCRRDVLLHIRELRNQLAEHEQKIQTILAEVEKLERCS